MEKFSQYRDRGSGISPFLPATTPSSPPVIFLHTILFIFRLPFFLTYALTYFLLLHPLLRASSALFPRVLPVLARKLLLWGLMAIPGIWWVDLQLDGVKRGTLAEQPAERFPHPRSIIVASFTSPIDAIYLAAIFDPVFTISYPGTRLVRRVGLIGALKAALAPVQLTPPPSRVSRLTDLQTLLEENPHRVVAVFPECGTTNGRAVLPFSPSLLACPANVPIFPISIRYSPPDVTTPVPGEWVGFLWNLLSRPTTSIRVRIAESITTKSSGGGAAYPKSGGGSGGGLIGGGGGPHHMDNSWPSFGAGTGSVSSPVSPSSFRHDVTYGSDGIELLPAEQRVLNHIADALSRLGRNKRVGLTLKDKAAFVEAWRGGKKAE